MVLLQLRSDGLSPINKHVREEDELVPPGPPIADLQQVPFFNKVTEPTGPQGGRGRGVRSEGIGINTMQTINRSSSYSG